MIERLLPMEIPIFAVALFDGQPISIACGFHYAQKFTGYLLTYDEAQSKHSPAKLLIKLLMTEMINKGVTEFDFGRGSAEYKLRFTNCIRENHAALVYSDRFLSVLATIDQTRHQLTDTIKTKIKENHNFQPMVQTYKRISRKIRRLRF
ncbi:MAG TPA: GNAT family N-acetyltransferase, partial [Blastocatellia bacterium]|nr:GNAT family N-acetyltransferase [Blastocatellia bacterium]